MLRSLKIVALAVFFLSFFSGCEKLDPEEDIPSYLYIDTFTLTTNFAAQGAASEDIVDVWVFVDSDLKGVYELPATVPLNTDGSHSVQLFPGIKENGVSQNRDIYGLYKPFETTVDLTRKETVTIQPTTTYKDNVVFEWMEDFEDQALSMTTSGQHSSSDTLELIDNTNPNLFEPGPNSQYSAYINMDTSSQFEIFEMATLNKWNVPNGNNDVYLELNYKTNIPIQFGIYATKLSSYDQIPVVVVLPSNGEWKKMYINLRSETSVLADNDLIQIFFGMFNDGKDPDFVPEVYLDNLKLVYLN